MAKKIVLIDDIDGATGATETVLFGIDGIDYEIDLSDANAQRLRDCLEPFAGAGRRTTPRKPPAASPGSYVAAAGRRQQLDAIRSWAKSQGFEVSDRGRIPVSIQTAFDQAH